MASNIQMNPVGPLDLNDTSNLEQRWQRWIKSFMYYVGAMNVSDEAQKKNMLLHCAGTDVQEIFDTLTVDEGEDISCFSAAIEALEGHFKDKKNVSYERHVFRQARQRDGESVLQYVTRLRVLAVSCEYGERKDEAIKDQVVDLCRSKELRKKLLQIDNVSLDKVLQVARQMELVDVQAKEMEPEPRDDTSKDVRRITSGGRSGRGRGGRGRAWGHPQRDQQRDPQRDPQRDRHRQTCMRCGRFGHTAADVSCGARTRKCNKCTRVGHYAKMCKSKTIRMVQSENQEEDYVFCLTNDKNVSKNDKVRSGKTNITINEVEVEVLIDTGSSVNVINKMTYGKLHNAHLIKTSTKVYPYASTKELRVEGEFVAEVKYGDERVKADILVIEGDNICNILSNGVAQRLGLIEFLYTMGRPEERYPRLFKGVGKLTNFKLKMHVDQSIHPVVQPSRRIPYMLREKVEKKLDQLVSQDIIEKVSDIPTSWASPLVIIPKGNNDVRLCVDMRIANKAVIRERYPIPTVDEVLLEMTSGMVFSKLDLKWGYHQIELKEESRELTTFSTHKGYYRYKRLMFGISAAPEMYQNIIQQILSDCEGAQNISDDIIVYGKDTTEHDQRLEKVLEVLEKRGLTLNPEKCNYRLNRITFMGHVLGQNGITPHQAKIDAVKRTEQPQDATLLRSFLGLAGFVARYIPDFETTVEPLRRLTRQKVPYIWSAEQEEAFQEIKRKLSSSTVLAYFNKNARTQVFADASPVGMGAVLVQEQRDGNFKPVCYAAKALSPVERRYSQTEKEALALVWSCERFRNYLIGKEFELLTDHKPLEVIYGARSKPSARIERWVLRLQQFDYTVKHIPGKMNIADVLSRLSTGYDKTEVNLTETEEYVRAITTFAVPKTLSARQIEEESRKDDELNTLRQDIKTGDFRHCEPAYRVIKDEFTTVGYIIMRQSRIVIPKSLRRKTVELAHQGHQGIVKTKARLREKVWWPGIDRDCEEYCRQCHGCQVVSRPDTKEPIKVTSLPDAPWQDLALDFIGPFPTGEMVLVIVDYYSRYFLVNVMKKATTEKVIEALEESIDLFGIPYSITTDNGPQFISEQLKMYLEHMNIIHHKATPRWPQANGEVERQNRSLLKAMRALQAEGKDWRKELKSFLRAYRTTPHTTTGVSPAELMFKRKLRTGLPTLRHVEPNEEVRDRDRLEKFKRKEYADIGRKESNVQEGDTVLMRQDKQNKLTPTFSGTPMKVARRDGTQVTIQSPEGATYKRNVSDVKRYEKPPDEDHVEDNETREVEENPTENVVERPQRTRRTPSSLKDYVLS